jgi:hypothetical protein
LGRVEAAEKNGLSAGGIVGLLLGIISLLGLICFGLKYRFVCENVDDNKDEDLIEVGEHMVTIRRTKSLEKEASSSKDNATLATYESDSFLDDDASRSWCIPSSFNSERKALPFVDSSNEQAIDPPLWTAYEERQKDRRQRWIPRPGQAIARIQEKFRERKERTREEPPQTCFTNDSPPEWTTSSTSSTPESFDPIVESTPRSWFDVLFDPFQADDGRMPPSTVHSTHGAASPPRGPESTAGPTPHDEAAQLRRCGPSFVRDTEGFSWDEKMFL